jgi:outer membrane immunogenic protein
VLGVEGDLNLNSADASRSFGSGLNVATQRNWTSSLRARAGYTFGSALVYATVGAAATGQTTTVSDASSSIASRTPYLGYVVGGGIEWKFAPQVSLRTEVLHFGFGERTIDFSGSSLPVKFDETVFRAGVTFHFN